MKLKIGDKVQIVKCLDFPDMVGKVYKVKDVMRPNKIFACRVIDVKTGWSPLMYGFEIKKVVVKNQQLLFNFMDE